MGTVTDLTAYREHKYPTEEWRAMCTACKGMWRAVVPVGTNWLECPHCGLETGAETHLCPCGSDVFQILPSVGIACVDCGEVTLNPGPSDDEPGPLCG